MNIEGRLLELRNSGGLLDAIFGQPGIKYVERRSQLVEALVHLSAAGEIDLPTAIIEDGLRPVSERDLFAGLAIFCDLLPLIDTDLVAAMRATSLLVDRAGTDLASNLPYVAFQKHLARDTAGAKAERVLSQVRTGSTLAQEFTSFALIDIATRDAARGMTEARELIGSDAETVRIAVCSALGRMPKLDGIQAATALALLVEVGRHDTVAARGNALVAGAALVAAHPSLADTAVELVDGVLEHRDDHTLQYVAAALRQYGEHLAPELIGSMLDALVSVKPENGRTLGLIDGVLVKLWRRGRTELVIGFLEGVAADPKGAALRSFKSTVHEIVSSGGAGLDWTAARWLLGGNAALCSVLDKAISSPAQRKTTFEPDFVWLKLTDEDLTVIARRAVGWFFLHPVLAAGPVVSALRIAREPAAVEELVELLFDPLLMNFSGALHDYLRKISSDPFDAASTGAAEAIARQDRYLEGLRSVDPIAELRPTERQRAAERQRQDDAMQESYRSAQQHSIFGAIATKKQLLHGQSHVYYFPGRDSARSESKLGVLEHIIECPRVNIVDPVGLELQLLMLRSGARR